jgi:hypothetical protein
MSSWPTIGRCQWYILSSVVLLDICLVDSSSSQPWPSWGWCRAHLRTAFSTMIIWFLVHTMCILYTHEATMLYFKYTCTSLHVYSNSLDIVVSLCVWHQPYFSATEAYLSRHYHRGHSHCTGVGFLRIACNPLEEYTVFIHMCVCVTTINVHSEWDHHPHVHVCARALLVIVELRTPLSVTMPAPLT